MTRPRTLISVLLVVAVVNIALFAVETLLFTPLHVPSSSMAPTLRAGDRVAVNHRVDFDDIERGDLVVLAVDRSSSKPQPDPRSGSVRLVVKRVIGLPEENVEALNGVVAVDGDQRLPEPYLYGKEDSTNFPLVQLGDDELWVLGDNRDNSTDSRAFGAVPRESILGVVSYRYWPPSRVRGFA